MLNSAVKNHQFIKKILVELGESVLDITEKDYRKNNGLGLLGGLTGDLLFLYKLNQHNSKLVDEDIFNQKLELLQNELAHYGQRLDLSGGISGMGWFLEYINQNQGVNYDPSFCEEIDSLINEMLSVDTWSEEIEMILGLGGPAIYAGRRLKKSRSSDIFEKLVTHFEKQAIQFQDNTLTWSQPSNSVYRFNKDDLEAKEFNLGLAHGVPGIVAALLPALKIPELHKRTKSLLIQSCDWLLNQELSTPQKDSYFSSSSDNLNSTRLGWCYGDLPIALTLARVGKALKVSEYCNKAKEIALHAAERDSKSGIIKDAGLCHGSAGLVLMFQLLNQHLNEPKLLEAANKWLEHTLKLYHSKGKEGFYAYFSFNECHEEDIGFLMGYSGIGLCLLASLGEKPDWIDCILLA